MQGNLAVSAQGKTFSRSIQINIGLIVLPINMDNGFVFIRAGIRPPAAFIAHSIYNGILNLDIDEAGIGNKRVIDN